MESSLISLFSNRAITLLDGAMGTELARRGVDVALPLWSARALETAPDLVLAIHRDYRAAGARVLTANTFRTTAPAYRKAGLDEAAAQESARRATQRAIALAKEAAGDQAVVAGSLAPVGDCYTPADYPGPDVAWATYRDLARWIAEAGADLLLLETHITLDEARIALEAAAPTGLPTLVSYLVNGELNLWGGASLAAAAEVARQGGAQGIMINCVTLAVANKAVKALAETTTLPFGVYANAGRSQPSREGVIRQRHSDGNFVAAAREWITSGASLIGGCCGTTPNTIRALNRLLASP
ncbi:MAG: homocysteine S-methyltransferase family protein [Candidatus Marinimicrobia bacterium]|nr:homocysteine S-methyltransferase family protein [Candidatus Neomarinimicrobiota bacterium]